MFGRVHYPKRPNLAGSQVIPLPDFSDLKDLRNVCEIRLKRLGAGAFRSVYSLGDGTALKLPYDGSMSSECNRREADIWAEVKETPYAEVLAPVIACAESGAWLIMQEVGVTLSASKSEVEGSWATAGSVRPRASGLIPGTKRRLWAEDLHPDNVARRPDGSLVVLDYGNFSIEDA